jgi:hypothetical protein
MINLVTKNNRNSQVWWCTPVISVLGWLKQDDHEFEAGLDYILRSCLKIFLKNQQICYLMGSGVSLIHVSLG